MRKSWREAASLILTARKPVLPRQTVNAESTCGPPRWGSIFDYQVLMLKRSSKSKFMPNAYVFPGGVISKADFSKGWLDLFHSKGVYREDLEALVLEARDRPLLMLHGHPEETISRDVAFRLTAIRETFEESGILLYSQGKGDGTAQAFSFPDPENLENRRKKVHEDPEELLKLYRELDVLPDIWGLTEWSAWLTPTDLHEQGKRRFDTLFYLANLTTIPETVLDKAEISSVEWTYAGTILNDFYRGKLWLAPPQVYELSRMLNFTEQSQLHQFSKERHHKGCVSWLPVRLQCDDGLLSLLPGDSMYPSTPDLHGDPDKRELNVYKGTMKDCEKNSASLNRLEFKDMYDCIPRVTSEPQHGHVHPREYHHFQTMLWSDKGAL